MSLCLELSTFAHGKYKSPNCAFLSRNVLMDKYVTSVTAFSALITVRYSQFELTAVVFFTEPHSLEQEMRELVQLT